MKKLLISLLLLVFGSSFAIYLAAQALEAPPIRTQSNQTLLTEHRWLSAPLIYNPAAYFTNLKNGDSVVSPFVVQFGMSSWGIVPAEHKHPKTGHHHLLVDIPLSIAPTTSLPFSKNYMHFGKGQMQTVLDLPPGRHTLRLLLADYAHVPHMVFSPEIVVNVIERNAAKAEQLKKIEPELSFPNLQDGDTVTNHFKVLFHAAGLNVGNKLARIPDTGYFQLKIAQQGGKTERIAFPSGQTEIWLKLPDGEYKFQLEYIKNPTGELHDVVSKIITLRVNKR
jgi:hypothetical protein